MAAPFIFPELSQVSVAATANGSERDGSPVMFSFSRTESAATPLSEPFSLSYTLLGNALAGLDYSEAGDGTITFEAGAATATLSLPALADGVIDPGETVIARILPSSAYTIAPGGQLATATIDAEGVSTIPSSDGRFDNPSQAEWRNPYAFAALRSDGTVVSWGLAPFGGESGSVDLDGPDDNLTISQIFSNGYAFAALRSDGSVATWGAAPLGGDSSGVDFNGPSNDLTVVSIASTERAFAARLSDGSVVAWGNIGVGGATGNVDFNGPDNDLLVTAIVSNRSAFAALRSDGSVVSWGNPLDGGSSTGVDFDGPNDNLSVTRVFASERAFAALRSNGTVVTWGKAGNGGDSNSVDVNGPSGDLAVVGIAPTERAFAALRSDGSVVCWGDPGYGGNSAGVDFDGPRNNQSVAALFANRYAFTALRTDGSVVAWGDSRYGGDLDGADLDGPSNNLEVVGIAATDTAFAALRSDGTVVTWGLASDGGDSSGIDFNGPRDDLRVSRIYANRSAFAALRSDGSLISWGNAGLGGNSSNVDFDGPEDNLIVTSVIGSDGAFVALRSDGSVVSWGSAISGGNSSSVDFDGPNNNLKVVGFADPGSNDRFSPQSAPVNQPPTAVTLVQPSAALPENTPTAKALALAMVVVSDDGLGSNQITLAGPDAASFVLEGLALNLKAGVTLDYEQQARYAVRVEVRDSSLAQAPSVGAAFELAVENLEEGPATLTPIRGPGLEGFPLQAGDIIDDPDGLPADPQPAYQWLRDGAAIAGATARTFTPSATGEGAYSVEVSYTDGAGIRTSLRSAEIGVAKVNNGDASIAISGNLRAGGSASVGRTSDDPDGNGAAALQSVAWETSTDQATWAQIATGPSLVIPATAAGQFLRARMAYRDGQGYATALITEPVTVGPPEPPEPLPPPVPPVAPCDPVTGEATSFWPPPLNPNHPGHRAASKGKGLARKAQNAWKTHGAAHGRGKELPHPLLAMPLSPEASDPWAGPPAWTTGHWNAASDLVHPWG